ncbi:YebC/PmpR family DNA-binding transcriptional regulator [Candidatus Dependentiae bacterium]|nr:YebC/PmpR family DNA-binding transcriptional regulator [Candidatus Dependentiae bacterium]
MSGHSKWSTIKHKKAKEDAKRGKIFTKLIREITIAAKEGGGDPTGNARLRVVIDKAKAANMPQDNITRAIKKGTGELEGVSYEESTYEGYGPHGVAVIVETLSDNKKRTVSAVRHIFSKMGGNLAESGSVSWMFEHKGVVKVNAQGLSEDEILEKMLDFDIDDVLVVDNIASISCDVKNLDTVKKGAQSVGLKVEDASIEWVPKNTISLEEKEEEKVYKFLEALEDLDDVQNVYANLA